MPDDTPFDARSILEALAQQDQQTAQPHIDDPKPKLDEALMVNSVVSKTVDVLTEGMLRMSGNKEMQKSVLIGIHAVIDVFMRIAGD